MFQYLNTVTLGQVQVQQKQIRTGKIDVHVHPVDKSQDFLPVGDYAKLTWNVVLAECFSHKPHICRVVFGKNNLAE
jgi:hypothetical protein